MADKMRAWLMATTDKGYELSLHQVARPQPEPGEVLVKVHATSLNRGEFIRGSRVAAVKSDANLRPCGLEAAGEIAALGTGVTGLKVGDRVMGRANGGFAEYTTMDAREVIPVPANLGWEDAGATAIVFMTAYDLVVAGGGLRSGEWLLVTGVSSGVGVACVQIAHALGAKTIGTSGSEKKIEVVKSVGLDHGILTRKPDFAETVRKLSGGHGADVAVNNVGGTMFGELIKSLAYMGRLGIVGYVDGSKRAEIDLDAVHAQRLKIYGVSNKLRTAAMRAETAQGVTRDIVPLLAAGKIRPVIDEVFAFESLPAAKARMEADAHVGKIVVTL